MKINSLRDLKKLIQLCRTMGVEAIELDGIKLDMGSEPVYIASTPKVTKAVTSVYAPGGITEDTKIDTAMPSEEDLLFWSTNQTADPQ